MRILIASVCLPWPLNTGGNAAQFSTLKCLAEDHEFTLVCPAWGEEDISHGKELQSQLPQVKVRAVPFRKPPESNVRRVIQEVKKGVELGRRLLNPPVTQAAGPEKLYYPFNPLPEKLIVALKEELSNKVDICQAEFAETLPLGAWFPKEVPKLFIHHQIHFVYAQRFLDSHGDTGYTSYLKTMIQVQEQAYLRTFDGVVTFSDQDRNVLMPYVVPEKLFTSPFPIPSDVGIAEEVPEKFDGRFLFVASGEHAPNRDALKWLLDGIWPEVLHRNPAVRLVVIGKWSEAAQAQFAATNVSFAGFVSDLSAAMRGGILLVPLRIGSGIRVKIMAALAQGVPVVTTSVGSEGMLLKDGEDLLVHDKEIEFAAAAVELSTNAQLWRHLAHSGKAAISKHYSPAGVRKRRNEIYAALIRR
ncbi:MAG TPA: glycosyltransferase [Verrucomicrobiae bacterium]